MNLRPEEISSVIKEQIKQYSTKLETSDIGTLMLSAARWKISLMPEHFQSRRKPKPPVQRRIRLADRKFICGKKCSRFCRCCIYIKIERHKQKKRLSVKE